MQQIFKVIYLILPAVIINKNLLQYY